MKIYKTVDGVCIELNSNFFQKEITDWDAFINRTNLYSLLVKEVETWESCGSPEGILAPIENQEIWASGVTYMRSRDARMEESKDAGGGTFYDRVYVADRPELFFKATAARTVGPNGTVRIRKDSKWNVPEPELALLLSSEGTIEGYTIGNDMSSRDIEGENPLYLPQAKTYEACAALGPCIYLSGEPIDPDSLITLEIFRSGATAFKGEIPLSNMKRKLTDLVGYLFRECNFPKGCFLMTGTGIIPPDEFTLHIGDEVHISIDNIGTLINTVGQ
ncbi:fumarylacetoacetate hydrolase family protein [Aurantibacter sp.]|uniref:fumarylacetoacetate hydrolase family protein n=1 Tax=Aurantibacter sp. TaxID=2807103 RepID=UPI00326352B3